MLTEKNEQWHEIKTEGNPKEAGYYLIFTNECDIFVAVWNLLCYERSIWNWDIHCLCVDAEGSYLEKWMITHWMNLPSNPEIIN